MKTLLLIDDEKPIRAVLLDFLVQNGWKVIEADDGDTGLNLAVEYRPDALICDLRMPRCNGIEVCRFVRQRPELRHTKVIVTSGIGAYERDRLDALEAGADEYLTKPLNLPGLLDLINRFSIRESESSITMPLRRSTGEAKIKFWGVRGSIPTPGPTTVFYGGNTACVEINADGEIIILDAGTGIRPLGLDLAERFKEEPLHLTLLISHTHWDHIQGFPFFRPAWNSKNRLRILGFHGSRDRLGTTLTSQMESPYFPVGLDKMPGNIVIEELKEMSFHIGTIPVQSAYMNHPGICVGYRLNTSAGSIAYLPDNEPSPPLRTHLSDQANGASEFLDFGRKRDDRLVDFVRDSTVLIIDSQFDADEYRTHTGWGHGSVDDVVSLACSAQVKNLFLFHHDPNHDDAKISSMVSHARELIATSGETIAVEAAREGLEFILKTKELVSAQACLKTGMVD